ncbi:Metallo-dependent hydrolase [Meredithblackwellia eburnea MCA 4105]
MSILRFTNCKVASKDGLLENRDVYIDTSEGKIISGQSYFFGYRQPVQEIVDLDGKILAPGFIDAQINGAYGVDFSLFNGNRDHYLKGLEKVAKEIVETGTTSFLPTVITQDRNVYPKILPMLSPQIFCEGAQILGYHAEGPFLHPDKKGAHNEQYLETALLGIHSFDGVYGPSALDQNGVRLLTVAPDVEGVLDSIKPLTERGVVVSIGHSNATVTLATDALEAGARWITHLFNAMPPMHHRDPGIVGTLGAKEQRHRPFYGIIADAIHVHPATVRMAYDCHPDGCVLVTDAMPLMNPRLPDGRHHWREGRYIRKEGMSLYIDGTETLAGSAITMDQCIRNLVSFTTCSLSAAIKCASYNVAQMIGGDVAKRKGRIEEGWDADLVVLDKEGVVFQTWVRGKKVWERETKATKQEERGVGLAKSKSKY